MKISILYRTYDGSNDKLRPVWFDRGSALRSLRVAMANARVPVSLTFVVDGRMPQELKPLVEHDDAIITIRGGSTAKSFRECVKVAVALARHDAPDTFYWFAEDDYAYRRESLASLASAVNSLPWAQYFTLYVPDEAFWHSWHLSQPLRPLATHEQGSTEVEGTPWHRVRETTSTFGVRASTLRADHRLLRLGSTVGAPFDMATWVALQGVAPFSYRHLTKELNGFWGVRGVAKVAGKPVMRLVLNVAARTRAHSQRALVAPVGDLAMHLESSMIPPGQGWDTLGEA